MKKMQTKISSKSAEKRSVSKGGEFYHLNDKIFQKISQHKCFLIPLVNNFGPKYELNTGVTYLNCRGLFDSDDNEIVTDLVVRMDESPDIYHLEAQTLVDTNMPERIYEYDTSLVKMIKFKDKGGKIIHILIQIEGESGDITLEINGAIKKVNVVNVQKLSMKEILNKGFYLLIPFYICRYRDELKEDVVCDTIKKDIKKAFEEAYDFLNNLYNNGKASNEAIIDMKNSIFLKLRHLVPKDKQFIKEVAAMAKEDTLAFDTMHATEWEIKFHDIYEKLGEATTALEQTTQENEEQKQVIKDSEKLIKEKSKEITNEKNKNKRLAAEIEKLKAIIAAAGLSVKDDK